METDEEKIRAMEQSVERLRRQLSAMKPIVEGLSQSQRDAFSNAEMTRFHEAFYEPLSPEEQAYLDALVTAMMQSVDRVCIVPAAKSNATLTMFHRRMILSVSIEHGERGFCRLMNGAEIYCSEGVQTMWRLGAERER